MMETVDYYMADFGNIRLATPSLRERIRASGAFGLTPATRRPLRRRGNTWYQRFEKQINAAAEYFWRMGSCLKEIDERGRFVLMEPTFPIPPPAPYVGWRTKYVTPIDDDTDVAQIVSEVTYTYVEAPLTCGEFLAIGLVPPTGVPKES